MLIAGRDTTAVTLTWFFYMMIENPSCEARVRKEIEEAFADGEEISLKSVKQLKYLDNSLHETLRLFPAVPAESRVSVKVTKKKKKTKTKTLTYQIDLK